MSDEKLTRHERIKQGPVTQKEYEDVVDEVATLRMNKVLSYGEARYNDSSLRRSLSFLFADVMRKVYRLENIALSDHPERILENSKDGESFRDTMADLANFGLMGVQLFDTWKRTQPQVVERPGFGGQTMEQIMEAAPDPVGLDIANVSEGWHVLFVSNRYLPYRYYAVGWITRDGKVRLLCEEVPLSQPNVSSHQWVDGTLSFTVADQKVCLARRNIPLSSLEKVTRLLNPNTEEFKIVK